MTMNESRFYRCMAYLTGVVGLYRIIIDGDPDIWFVTMMIFALVCSNKADIVSLEEERAK